MKYGYEGLGLFYTALEKLAAQEKPINTEVLKAQLKVGKHLDKIFQYCETLGILCSNNGETFSKQLLNYAGKYAIKKEKNREKVAQWRENQIDINIVTGYVPFCNHYKVKLSKVKVYIYTPPADEPPATPPKFNFKQNLIKLGANEQHVADLMAARSKKHLANTETALKLFISQAGKLNMTIPEAVEYCAGRSWGGLRVEYVQKETPTNTFTGQDEADMIEHIKNLSEFDWSVAKSKLVFDETNSLFHPGKQKYISYDTLTKCDRLMKYTTDIFRAKSLTLTPATYGKRSK